MLHQVAFFLQLMNPLLDNNLREVCVVNNVTGAAARCSGLLSTTMDESLGNSRPLSPEDLSRHHGEQSKSSGQSLDGFYASNIIVATMQGSRPAMSTPTNSRPQSNTLLRRSATTVQRDGFRTVTGQSLYF